MEKIQNEISLFQDSYLRFKQDFKNDDPLNVFKYQNKLDQIENIKTARMYAEFITNVIEFMDNCRWSNEVKVNKNKF